MKQAVGKLSPLIRGSLTWFLSARTTDPRGHIIHMCVKLLGAAAKELIFQSAEAMI
jgi:hypothetical protein